MSRKRSTGGGRKPSKPGYRGLSNKWWLKCLLSQEPQMAQIFAGTSVIILCSLLKLNLPNVEFFGVSHSGYRAWLCRVPSDTEKRCEAVKTKIQDIYDHSKQNYGAPKITVYWSKSWIITTKDSDFSIEL